ncbi:nuclear transport factor 2 family protein [Sphingomonas sp. 2SG]|uniref:nuclear transport factor 2 family protein n=1 Tax=Sphingomonas sp. 2SG TaxID=2502201 RepID=UPI0010F9A429|nr:nuclear transport factor 2 family protein [Sphingomonas sp. 2SG]
MIVPNLLLGNRALGVAMMANVILLPSSAYAQQVQQTTRKNPMVVTKRQAWDLYAKLHTAWNSESLDERRRIAAEVLDENIEYQTVRHDTTIGRTLVIEDMATFHERFPGGHFEVGDVSAHHNVALLTWVLIQADGKEFARGGDQITVGDNGKIIKITTFGPSTKTPD